MNASVTRMPRRRFEKDDVYPCEPLRAKQDILLRGTDTRGWTTSRELTRELGSWSVIDLQTEQTPRSAGLRLLEDLFGTGFCNSLLELLCDLAGPEEDERRHAEATPRFEIDFENDAQQIVQASGLADELRRAYPIFEAHFQGLTSIRFEAIMDDGDPGKPRTGLVAIISSPSDRRAFRRAHTLFFEELRNVGLSRLYAELTVLQE